MSPEIVKTELICEKILDFLNTFPYIHPEIFYIVPITWEL